MDLYNALKSLGAINFDLLIVAEKKNAEKFNNHSSNYMVDFVDYFPPDADVTGKKYRKNGWDKIFDKLSVSRSTNSSKRKKYKFENHKNMLKAKFDLIFSLGEACSCTETLRKCRLQFYSYPFDWLFGASFIERCNIITSGFENWLRKENLEKIGDNNISKIPKHIYKNNLTKIVFNHDFPQNLSLDESFSQVKQKYDRRISRLLKNIVESKKVLVVYIQTPHNATKINKNEILEGFNILTNKFGDKINLLYIYCNPNATLKNREEIDLNANVKYVGFDYNAYNKDFPYIVNHKILTRLFNKIKITNKFLTKRNIIKRLLYRVTLLCKGQLWKKY